MQTFATISENLAQYQTTISTSLLVHVFFPKLTRVVQLEKFETSIRKGIHFLAVSSTLDEEVTMRKGNSAVAKTNWQSWSTVSVNSLPATATPDE
jgi:hypothetical protein